VSGFSRTVLLVLQRSTRIDPDGAPSRREYGECDHPREERRGPNVCQRIDTGQEICGANGCEPNEQRYHNCCLDCDDCGDRYAELFVSPVCWPEFRRKQLLEALTAYAGRKRKFGGLIQDVATPAKRRSDDDD